MNSNINMTLKMQVYSTRLICAIGTVLLSMMFVLPSNAQVVVDAVSTGSEANAVTTITVSHTTGSGSGRLMLVGISHREASDITSVTYGAETLELVGTEGSSTNAKTHIYSLLNPASGTANVVVTTAGDFDQGGIVGVVTFTGVDLSDPLNTYASAGNNSTNPTLSGILSDAGDMVFNVVALQNTNLTGVGAGQTSRWNIASGDDMRGGGSTKAGASPSVTMSWTSAADDWSMSAVSINALAISDLQIAKTVNNPTPNRGQTIVFTLTATNNGPEIAPGVLVTDLLPSGFTYSSHSTVTGTYNFGSGVWDIGSLNVSASATLTINAIVNSSGSYTNTATIDGDVLDNTSGNNSASASIILCQAGATKPLFNN